MQINLLVPVLYPILGSFVVYAIGRKNKNIRDYAADFIVISEFLLLLITSFIPYLLGGGAKEAYELKLTYVAGLGLHLTMDGFRALYTTVAAFMWVVSTVFSREYFKHYRNRNRYTLFLLWTLGATMGVFLSSDLFTTFLFFEMASFTSYVWVAQEEKREALRAAETYLAIAVIGGLVMLMGLFLLYSLTGTLEIAALRNACAAVRGSANGVVGSSKRLVAAGVCLFFGFAAKAGAAPLHVWLPKAHPVAPAPASALLSGMLTKVGVFGILVVSSQIFFHDGSFGTFVLTIGVLTMLTGAILALFSIDLKRTLACSSVSQIGFILIGVGMQGLLGEENALAVRGTLLYMVNHSLFKLVLFISAGVIFMNLHKLDLNIIRGFGRKKPLLHGAFLCSVLGIAGVPFFSGYVSKTLVHESMVEYMHLLSDGHADVIVYGLGAFRLMEWLFLISGGMTLAYMLKLYICIFIEKNTDDKLQDKYDGMKAYVTPVSALLITVSAMIFPILGFFPNRLFDKFADMGQSFMNLAENHHTVHYFTWVNLKGSLISLAIGAILYMLVVRGLLMKQENENDKVYVNRWNPLFDLENTVYRPMLGIVEITCSIFFRICDRLVDWIVVALRKTIYRDSKLPHELIEGTPITHTLGVILDDGEMIINKTIRRKNPFKLSFEHKLALVNEEIGENNTIIGRSLSFGLFMFCLGLILTLAYMLWA